VAPIFTGPVMASFWEVGYLYPPQPPQWHAAVPKVPSVLPCHSLLSQSHSCSPQPLFVRLLDLVRSLSWVVEREAKVSSLRALKPLEHCWTSSSPCEVFVTLGGVPPRRLGVARELPRCGELWDSL